MYILGLHLFVEYLKLIFITHLYLQIISENPKYVNFFLQVSDKGIEIQNHQLREAARCILKLIPPAESTVKKIKVLSKHFKLKPSLIVY